MIHFVVGTRAQLFKLAPVMLECEERDLDWRWVYTAQHRDTIERTAELFWLPPPDHVSGRVEDGGEVDGPHGSLVRANADLAPAQSRDPWR